MKKRENESLRLTNNSIRYHIPHQSEISWFRRRLIIWYQHNKRDFPWRSSRDPYLICLAEIFLQQTSADRVASTLFRLIERFPNWEVLSKADVLEIEDLIFPLGIFRRRAKVIQSLARSVILRGGLPANREELEQLPGIGQYIASVLLAMFHNKKEPFLDVNMSRVLERYFGPREMADIRDDPYLQVLSRKVVNVQATLSVNWMILDFAALVCTKRRPRCLECTLSERCRETQKTI